MLMLRELLFASPCENGGYKIFMSKKERKKKKKKKIKKTK